MILVDGRNLQLEKGTGVATYGRCLTTALRRLGHKVGVLYGKPVGGTKDDLLREIRFFDVASDDGNADATRLGRALTSARYVGRGLRFTAKTVPTSEAVVKRQFEDRLPQTDEVWNSDRLYSRAHRAFELLGRISPVTVPSTLKLAHWTYPLPLRVPGVPNIYTLHDLVPLKLPYTTLDNKRQYLRLVRRIAREADHIVTVSECSRNDIIELLGVEPSRVTNTYQTADIDPEIVAMSDDDVDKEVRRIFGVSFREYFMFWGAIEPKKNVGRLVEAFLRSGVKRPLLVVGSKVFGADSDLRLAERAKGLRAARDAGRIIHVDYLPRTLLLLLARGARATLFPSLYEGFGLPVLESMALGTPVLTSTASSLPEVSGPDAARLVDPYDVQAIADGIRDLDTSNALREQLIGSGTRRAAGFSSLQYGERLSGLYQRFGGLEPPLLSNA
jgi:glycosyltransferase involved in cell wall biosynthesis